MKSPVLRRTISHCLYGIWSSALSLDSSIWAMILLYSSLVNGIGCVSAPTINLTHGVFLTTYQILSFILDFTKTYHGYIFLVLMIFSPFFKELSLTIGDKKSTTSSCSHCFLILSLRFSTTSSSCQDTTLSTYRLCSLFSICFFISFADWFCMGFYCMIV